MMFPYILIKSINYCFYSSWLYFLISFDLYFQLKNIFFFSEGGHFALFLRLLYFFSYSMFLKSLLHIWIFFHIVLPFLSLTFIIFCCFSLKFSVAGLRFANVLLFWARAQRLGTKQSREESVELPPE